ncbi:uncharacterized protein LOC133913578 isoform X2 [Phragmites australis]|uniref:uncharacterized protein LOC133913578 isoform X2 n=1 Tax=Phragmites australis TaxID=29695 RepID=UPI002D7739E9|nr:uncharacterized protein LOC133913578 isoform X2 [Phragmites australis]
MPSSPIMCRPSAAWHPLLLHVPTTLGLGLGLPRRGAVIALRVHVWRIKAEPWASALVGVSRNRREEAVRCAAVGEVVGSTGVGRSAGMEVALVVVLLLSKDLAGGAANQGLASMAHLSGGGAARRGLTSRPCGDAARACEQSCRRGCSSARHRTSSAIGGSGSCYQVGTGATPLDA